MEWPTSANRGGASASTRRAIAPILSSRMWLATVTGPNRQSAGTTGAKIRGEDRRPGISRIGIVSSMGEAPDRQLLAGNRAESLVFEHDPFRKPATTFRDHARGTSD